MDWDFDDCAPAPPIDGGKPEPEFVAFADERFVKRQGRAEPDSDAGEGVADPFGAPEPDRPAQRPDAPPPAPSGRTLADVQRQAPQPEAREGAMAPVERVRVGDTAGAVAGTKDNLGAKLLTLGAIWLIAKALKKDKAKKRNGRRRA